MSDRQRRRVIAVTLAAVAALAVGLTVGLSQTGAAGSTATYLLPWAAGAENRQTVLQGVFRSNGPGSCTSGCATHRNEGMNSAWDFDMREGTPVLAARSGTVALVQGSWSPDHCGRLPGVAGSVENAAGVTVDGTIDGEVSDPLIGNQANFVLIDHRDGTSALYLHLSSVDPLIEEKARSGGTVARGEVLGRSGRTGLTGCQPHLHFQVQPSVRADWFTDSIPIHFVDRDVVARTPDGVPVEGESYVSDNVPG